MAASTAVERWAGRPSALLVAGLRSRAAKRPDDPAPQSLLRGRRRRLSSPLSSRSAPGSRTPNPTRHDQSQSQPNRSSHQLREAVINRRASATTCFRNVGPSPRPIVLGDADRRTADLALVAGTIRAEHAEAEHSRRRGSPRPGRTDRLTPSGNALAAQPPPDAALHRPQDRDQGHSDVWTEPQHGRARALDCTKRTIRIY